uniref:Putative secreted protein n=1 Tax=Anopheles triannulatus TaxID=58253 RepID=A0A2M4B629_9DIPT
MVRRQWLGVVVVSRLVSSTGIPARPVNGTTTVRHNCYVFHPIERGKFRFSPATARPGSGISFSHFHRKATHTSVHVTRNGTLDRTHCPRHWGSTTAGKQPSVLPKTERATLIQGNSRCNRGESPPRAYCVLRGH